MRAIFSISCPLPSSPSSISNGLHLQQLHLMRAPSSSRHNNSLHHLQSNLRPQLPLQPGSAEPSTHASMSSAHPLPSNPKPLTSSVFPTNPRPTPASTVHSSGTQPLPRSGLNHSHLRHVGLSPGHLHKHHHSSRSLIISITTSQPTPTRPHHTSSNTCCHR